MESKRSLLKKITMRIREVREKKGKGISMCELARRVHVSASEFSKYENHKTVPSVHTLVRIARVLKVTVDELIRRRSP